jgi:hypothetical protein
MLQLQIHIFHKQKASNCCIYLVAHFIGEMTSEHFFIDLNQQKSDPF